MSNRRYIVYVPSYANGVESYNWNVTNWDPYNDERIRNYDRLLHQTLCSIFHQQYLTSGQMQELLRGPQRTGQNSIFQLLLEREPALGEVLRQRYHLSLLWIVLLGSYQNSADLLLSLGVDINERCGIKLHNFVDEKSTILHLLLQMYPSLWNDRFVCDLISRPGMDLQAQDCRDRTPLHLAVRYGRVWPTKCLLVQRVPVNVVDEFGVIPFLEAACCREADQLVPMLIDHGSNVFAKDRYGQNALHRLAYAPVEHTELAKALVSLMGVSLNDRRYNLNGYQPIHLAAIEGKNKLVSVFLDCGANVNARAHEGVSPLYLAAKYNHPEILKTLLAEGANADLRTIEGRTALHNPLDTAVERRRNSEVNLRILMAAVADMFAVDCDGQTLFSLIDISKRSSSIQQMMLKILAVKRASLDPSDELTDEESVRQHPKLWTRYETYVAESREARPVRFNESCTLLDLLAKCRCQIAGLMRNPEFERKFKLCDLDKFYSYAGDMRRAVREARQYYRSMLKQETLIDKAFYSMLPHMVVRRVARYTIVCENCKLR